MLSKYLLIGEITKPQGVQGELRMRCYTDDIDNLLKLNKIYFKSGEKYNEVKLENIRSQGDWFIIKIENVDDRDQAEKFRAYEVYIDRNDASPLKEGEFYISDAVGAEIYNSKGEKIGVLKDILTEYVQYVYVLKTSEGTMLFPAVPEVFIEEKLSEGKLILNEEVLESIGVLQ